MKKQLSSYLQIALVVAAAALLMPVSAKTANLPTFLVTTGQAYFNPIGDLQFAFTGPNLSISGYGEFPPGPCGGHPGFPCGYAGDTINVNTGLFAPNGFGGTAGGINYPTLFFSGIVLFVGSPLVIPNSVDPILTETFYTVNNPMLTACSTYYCFPGGDEVFNVAFVPTGEVTIALQGPDQVYFPGLYTLSSAVYSFAATPEPSSIVLFGSGILGLAGVLRRKMSRLQ